MGENDSQTDFYFQDQNTAIRDLGEKQRILKDRLILIGQNLIELKEKNHTDNTYTTLVKFDNEWQMRETWVYPQEILTRFDGMSNSGGSWGPDGRLYLTGHDRSELYAVILPNMGSVLVLEEIIPIGNRGQGIAWDRTDPGVIYTIRKKDGEVVVFKVDKGR